MSSSSGNEQKPKKLKLSQDTGESDEFAILNMFQKEREACAKSISHFKFNKKRVKLLSRATDIPEGSKGVLYWMSRDQRVQDNWALLYAQHLALKVELPLYVCFCLVPKFLDATIRQYRFMLKGLKEVAEECRSLNIGFTILCGEAKHVLPGFIKQHEIGGVVTDFSPLRVPITWLKDVQDLLPDNVPFCQVDAHNIVPCWSASEKLEYGARTIRPKIHNKLQEFLTQFPVVVKHKFSPQWKTKPIGTDADWVSLENSLEVNREVSDVDWAIPGSKAGLLKLSEFCNERLKYFHEQRNDPTKEALSDLSPWFHFGQLSVQRSILTVSKYKSKYHSSVDAYIEEAVIRRELAENFCYYNSKYDSIEGACSWAKQTLSEHAKDKREYVYSLEQLEHGCTHDPLWNAAQTQMIVRGKMHGFLRMYWAKKILEWTDSPENALRIAIYLNDKYELDGRDPNGYVGCMWSICGVHDQGWKERTVFGKIRFMNFKGCQRKFDVNKFIRMYKK